MNQVWEVKIENGSVVKTEGGKYTILGSEWLGEHISRTPEHIGFVIGSTPAVAKEFARRFMVGFNNRRK